MAKKTSAATDSTAGGVFNYRSKAAELERLLTELQDPDIQIDQATRLHAEGLKLIGELETYLQQAEVEVKKHVAGA